MPIYRRSAAWRGLLQRCFKELSIISALRSPVIPGRPGIQERTRFLSAWEEWIYAATPA